MPLLPRLAETRARSALYISRCEPKGGSLRAGIQYDGEIRLRWAMATSVKLDHALRLLIQHSEPIARVKGVPRYKV